MRYLKLLIILFLIFFTGCEVKEQKEVKISINSWIGYAPIFYIHEKGWLSQSNIKIYPVVSLGESVKLYKAGITDGFAGTQREFFLANSTNDLVPTILIDRSNGADVVLSNFNLNELREKKEIETYLEIDSINKFVLDSFIKKYNLNRKFFNYNNKEQSFIATLKPSEKPTVIITYEPYSTILKNSGFKELSSTKEIEILVLDAIFLNSDVLIHNREKIVLFKSFIDRAIDELKSNPKEFYEVIKAYLEGQSYEEFISSLNEVQWLNKSITKELKEVIENNKIPLQRIII